MVKGEVHNFSRGSIPRNIMSLALPMTAAQLINVLTAWWTGSTWGVCLGIWP